LYDAKAEPQARTNNHSGLRSIPGRSLGAVALAFAGTVLLSAAQAQAATVFGQEPIDHVDFATASGDGTVPLTGWATDPARPQGATRNAVHVDRHANKITSTNSGLGGDAICPHPISTREGLSSRVGCKRVAVLDPDNPRGVLATSRHGRILTFSGWATDPNTSAPINVGYVLDGTVREIHRTTAAHRFARSWVMPVGRHRVCVYADNVGAGSANPQIGCVASFVAAPAPRISKNGLITRRALAVVGRFHYQWGGHSPATGFDCSGLTSYLYAQAGIAIVPFAQAQFESFRQIPRGVAQPGDLVFFHDGSGYVFHVGVFMGGNMMIAAADYGYPMLYQSIWSPDVTFGTITH
jgi:NlpC/P60 family protein